MKKLNKKGFTLAELLIVVAIIAILAAIAVPLFVGAMNDAEKAVGEGNVRAVKGLAVSYILGNPDEMGLHTDGNVWYAYAEVSQTGDVSNLKVSVGTPGASAANPFASSISESGTGVTATEDGHGWWKRDGKKYTVLVLIDEVTNISSTDASTKSA